ncbi:MAG TPA: hypothetical protein VM183_19505 [Burkholderiales bacterium]|nr:hypothetical protein [Burkholderiales bacterium]
MRTLLALVAAFFFGCALAAPFAVQLGDTRVALETPPGFSDVQATGSPRLLELAESLTSASNRIVLFALEDIDVRRFTVGDSPELRRYCLVVTSKPLEGTRVTTAAFRSLVSDAMRDLGRPAPAGSDVHKYLDGAPRGRPNLIAELRNEQDVVSVLQGTRVPEPPRSREPARYLLSTTTLLLVRGKALNLALYTMDDSPADVEWIRTTTLRWVEELQRLNNR